MLTEKTVLRAPRWATPARTHLMLSSGVILALAACGQEAKKEKGPPQVGFTVAHQTTVPMEVELPGRITPFEQGQVRPQVSGVIERQLFTEGALVHKGQPLYQIDASLYRAAAQSAAANLASAQASAEAAQQKAERYKPLAASQAVAQQDYTDAAATARQTAAAVAQQRANLATAQINLRYTTVPSPLTGRIGRSLYTQGALVTANQTDPLAVVSALDPVYVDIQQSGADMLKLRRQLAAGGAETVAPKVKLKLDDGTDYPLPGTLQVSEVTVDTSTGTVAMRAKFPNPKGLLLPGLFVRAKLTQAAQAKAFLVPQVALTRDPMGRATVFVVGKGNKAELRKVEAERTMGDQWVVTSGLADGDKLITQGVGKFKPGGDIRPVPDTTPQGAKSGKKPAGK
jgi:membrane fusion protein (multidrug efflux system)